MRRLEIALGGQQEAENAAGHSENRHAIAEADVSGRPTGSSRGDWRGFFRFLRQAGAFLKKRRHLVNSGD
ncbi:hypothetical protein ABTK26_20470, partial [Acinetobacter baumannii]